MHCENKKGIRLRTTKLVKNVGKIKQIIFYKREVKRKKNKRICVQELQYSTYLAYKSGIGKKNIKFLQLS